MAEKVYKNRVKEKYEKEVVPFLMKKFGYTTVMQCPRLVKIVINTGLGDIKDNGERNQTHLRSETHFNESEEIRRQLQGERRAEHRYQSYPSRRQNV